MTRSELELIDGATWELTIGIQAMRWTPPPEPQPARQPEPWSPAWYEARRWQRG